MKFKKGLREFVLLALLTAGALVTVTPFLYMISTALKGPVYVFEIPPRLIPEAPTWQNFVDAWTANQFGRYFFNSILVTLVAVAGILLLASMMAYAFARYDFWGKKALYALVIFFMTMPAMSLIVPQFILARDLALIDSLAGLIVMDIAQNVPFATFLLRGFLEEVPKEIEEAACIDGASPWGIYWRIILPLCKPALATSAIIAFLGAWDEYVWASTIINTPEKRTLPVGIAVFQGVHTTNWGLVFAASLIAIVPVLILFISLQKYFVKGMVAGAVKG
ncbi:MAG: carbohydrate ABC transporter permease [Chloroflexi bacterium]|nr:carbohydrate ABC transporter permease [Anaerolineaceae bacterium]NMB88278.1 carbohydrate ABC transporter permease [Chloroflexota bacterium]